MHIYFHRHDAQAAFREKIGTEFKEMFAKGFVSLGAFNVLANFQTEKEITKEEILQLRKILIELHLATDIDSQTLYIPSLIADENKSYIQDQLKLFKESKDSLAFHYSFEKCHTAIDLFNNLLSKLASNAGITAHKSYSEKVEYREIGVVGGFHGSMKVTPTGINNILQQESIHILEFLVLEIDCDELDDFAKKFARHKV